MLVKRLEMLPIECVARGYLVGSGWKDYQRSGAVCGIKLDEGLVFCSDSRTNAGTYTRTHSWPNTWPNTRPNRWADWWTDTWPYHRPDQSADIGTYHKSFCITNNISYCTTHSQPNSKTDR